MVTDSVFVMAMLTLTVVTAIVLGVHLRIVLRRRRSSVCIRIGRSRTKRGARHGRS